MARPRAISPTTQQRGKRVQAVAAGMAFDLDAFRTWALGDYGKAKATVYYTCGRIESMQREGLDVDVFLSAPAAARAEGNHLIAKLKLEDRPPHAVRTLQKALNWLVDYGAHFQPDAPWAKWKLQKEPKAIPRTIDLEDVARLWTEWSGDNAYETAFGRALAFVAYHGNFRRGELDRMRRRHLHPGTAQVDLPRAGKGSLSGLVEFPWTAFWPDSPLMAYLAVRVDVPDGDWLWTVPWTAGRPRPRRVRGHGLYRKIVAMGQDLGVQVNFIRSKRRSLSDLDERSTDPRVTQARARHVSIDMTLHYLGRVTSMRQRRELAERGVPGYEPNLARGVVRELPGALQQEQGRKEGQEKQNDGQDDGRHGRLARRVVPLVRDVVLGRHAGDQAHGAADLVDGVGDDEWREGQDDGSRENDHERHDAQGPIQSEECHALRAAPAFFPLSSCFPQSLRFGGDGVLEGAGHVPDARRDHELVPRVGPDGDGVELPGDLDLPEGDLLEARAHAPEGNEHQKVGQNHQEQDEQEGYQAASRQGCEEIGHAQNPAPTFFPLSSCSPQPAVFPKLPLAPRGDGGLQEAVTGAGGIPQALSGSLSLSPSLGRPVGAGPSLGASPVGAGGASPFPQEEVKTMPATFVLHESDVAKPVAQVEPILGRITATPSLGAQWRPQAGVGAPTRELPQQPQTRRITRAVKTSGAVEGTFTDAEVVAPSGFEPLSQDSKSRIIGL